MNLTKLDVLDGLQEIKDAISYEVDGHLLDSFPGM
jgi:adenylosuccinate synthase